MWLKCRVCQRYWKAHDSSNSVQTALCAEHREAERVRNFLPVRRGPTKPFSDYNPRPARVEALKYVSFGRRRITATAAIR